MKQSLATMIIGITLLCLPASLPLAQNAVKLPDPTSFVARIEAGNVSLAREWLDAGLPPDFLGSRIGSGAMIGAWEGNLEMIRLFLSRGADINAVNANGESALALAAWKGRADVVQWLIDRGARINAKPRQWSALHYAVFSGNKDITTSLISQGADIDARSTNGSTPLMMAVYEGREELAKVLIEKGADRRVKNDWNDGALEWAMRFDRLKMARMVTNPEEFNIAVAEPKEKWGTAQRSIRQSGDLETFLKIRDELIARGMPTSKIDDRIAAERVRIVRTEFNRKALPPRASTLEITASRSAPENQSAAIVYDKEKPAGFKVPDATYTGKPKMPPKVPARNY